VFLRSNEGCVSVRFAYARVLCKWSRAGCFEVEKFLIFFPRSPSWRTTEALHGLHIVHREGQKQQRVDRVAALEEPPSDEESDASADEVGFVVAVGPAKDRSGMLHDMPSVERIDRKQVQQRPPDAYQDVEIQHGVSPRIADAQVPLGPWILDATGFDPLDEVCGAWDKYTHGIGDRCDQDRRCELEQRSGK